MKAAGLPNGFQTASWITKVNQVKACILFKLKLLRVHKAILYKCNVQNVRPPVNHGFQQAGCNPTYQVIKSYCKP